MCSITSPIKIFNSFYYCFRFPNDLTLRVFGCFAYVYVTTIIEVSQNPELSNVSFLVTHLLKNYTSVITLYPKNFMSANFIVTKTICFLLQDLPLGRISMMKNDTCEYFESFITFDLPYDPARADKPKSFKLVISKSPNPTH